MFENEPYGVNGVVCETMAEFMATLPKEKFPLEFVMWVVGRHRSHAWKCDRIAKFMTRFGEGANLRHLH